MTIKILKIVFWLVFLLNGVFASSIDKAQAYRMANSILHYEDAFLHRPAYSVKTIEKMGWADSADSLYWVQLNPTGFILLSTDKRLTPLIAFSAKNVFSGGTLARILLKKRLAVEQLVIRNFPDLARQNQMRWTNGFIPLKKTYGDTVYYFPTPVWGQGNVNGVYVFNLYTPHHWPVGCVGTALAEVLAYYKWPVVGNGSHCYTENDAGQLCADFENTYYDWANMLDKYLGEHTSSAQRKAAGLLSYHAAISVNMDFASNGSTGNVNNTPNALHRYFRCSGHYKTVSASNFWNELIHNMQGERPAILAISSTSSTLGHAIVVDGYSERNGLFHLNMGWNGSDNGWYDIRGNWNVSGYDVVDGAAKGIVPSPMINPQVKSLSATEFVLSWRVSPRLQAQQYELQQATSETGPWTTLSSSIVDTFYQISVPEISLYYYRVRARKSDIWWDWSEVQEVRLGGPRYVTFNVDMRYQNLTDQDSVVLRGNLPPLKGSTNSPALKDEDRDSIYSITLPFGVEYVGSQLLYRFAIARENGTQLESFNRSYVIGPEEYQILDTVFFDDYTALDENAHLPVGIRLQEMYPNPFNESTTITYTVGQQAVGEALQIAVYDVLGKKICTLVNGKTKSGSFRIRFNGRNLASGLYVICLRTRDILQTRKILLLR